LVKGDGACVIALGGLAALVAAVTATTAAGAIGSTLSVALADVTGGTAAVMGAGITVLAVGREACTITAMTCGGPALAPTAARVAVGMSWIAVGEIGQIAGTYVTIVLAVLTSRVVTVQCYALGDEQHQND